jgi:transcriptional regulator with XRE-family HTH domain
MNKIKFYRKKANMTLKEVSEKACVAIGYISEIENDAEGTTNPTKDVMERIAFALKRTVPEVFFSK